MSTSPPLIYRTPVFKKDQPDDNFKFQPLPQPAGEYPYYLDIKEVIPGVSDQKLVFHMVGDTGSLRNPDFTKLVASSMAWQYLGDEKDQPQFLYHLGDIVYNHGEVTEYDRQFFLPYQPYPAPIFAIAGNHDSDVNPFANKPYKSLEPFVEVFCNTEAKHVAFSKATGRLSMTQPNIYWTLNTPVATIIGLHTNVPKYGIVKPEQRQWFVQELIAANALRPEKMVIVCMHHSPYSADINHGASLPMIELLEESFHLSGVRPDAVFGGHVHSYQRFIKTYPDGFTTTYIVAGAGGYDELHPVALVSDERFTNDNPLFTNVELQNQCGDKHGFLRITIEKTIDGSRLKGEYFSIAHEKSGEAATAPTLFESFSIKASGG